MHSEQFLNRVWIGRIASGLALMATGLTLIAGPAMAAEPAGKVDFDRDIRPILSDNCYLCHGPDEGNRKGNLRLDVRASAIKAAASGEIAILPGQADVSEMLRRIVSTESDYRMPPVKGNKLPLTATQIDLIRRWIDQGAIYTSHWAFQSPIKPPVPEVVSPGQGQIRNSVDYFILAKLAEIGLKPSPVADRTTLLRRLSLDLIGLPPTIAEVDSFLADRSSDAYEKQVDRLLASQHYGERWGRHWLDAARYADSDGFEKDKSRQVYFFRDYVIQALNKDLPYDQFIVEQLAGDLLPQATQDQIVATGFLRNSMLNEEGGVDPEQFRMDAMFDRMDAIGKTFLGLTIQCAQCHNHKYDPLTQEEYYRLFAFINNDHESQRVVYSVEELAKVAELQRQISELERGLLERTPDWESRQTAWEESVKSAQPEWTTLHLENAGDNGQRYFDMGDGSILAQGYAPTKFSTSLKGQTNLTGVTGFRLELLNDPNLPCNGPGRSFMGTCALTEFTIEATDASNPAMKEGVKIVKVTADYSNPERPLESNFYDKSDKKRVTGPVEFAIDGKDETAWGIDAGPGRRNQPRKAVFVAEKPFGFPGGTILNISLKQNHGGWNSDDHMNNNLGRFRISATTVADPVADPLPAAVRDVLNTPRDQRSAQQRQVLTAYWRTTVPEFQAINDQIEALWTQWPAGATALVLTPRQTPRETRLLQRGDFLKPDRQVTPGVPAFLHKPADETSPPSRLSFARWITDRRSPTTARVMVNRVWQEYFGTGLVASSEDLGTQSDPPSHPELLDWLAVKFMDQGWHLKGLHRLIVTSATYRQSSHVTEELLARDQFNRWLARAPRLRVDGEIVRDIALSASGLLNPKIGGPSIYSPAPGFLFVPPTSYGPFTWTEETGADRYRRALYTFRRRSTPYPVLQNFDTPNGDFSCVRRTRSNTPLQALTTLNETMFMEAARALAMVSLRDGGAADDARLSFAFRRCLSRPPSSAELTALHGLLEKQTKRFAPGGQDPWQLAANDPAQPPTLPDGISASQLATWTVVSRVLLNLDETMTKE